MRGNNGKNISSPGIAVPRIQMNTAKAHIHIAMRCELTAVFLYTNFYWLFRRSSESCRFYLYFEVQK